MSVIMRVENVGVESDGEISSFRKVTIEQFIFLNVGGLPVSS